jgi:hypothetical protein
MANVPLIKCPARARAVMTPEHKVDVKRTLPLRVERDIAGE